MRLRLPIRAKLTFGTLVPLFVAIFVCWLVGIWMINSLVFRQAQDKVRTDLNSAREVFSGDIDHIRDVVKLTGQTPFAAQAIRTGAPKEIAPLLSPLLLNEHLDFLTAFDSHGQILFRAANPQVRGDYHAHDFPIEQALAGKTVSGVVVLSHEELLQENPQLAERAVIMVRPTPYAKRYAKKEQRAGLCLVAASPVRDTSGAVVGALYGGMMVNGNNDLAERIRRIIYEGFLYQGRNIGAATVFLDDIRIATTVRDADGRPATGTLLSEEVYDSVILHREKWSGQAFVVNDWYLSAYEPIVDLRGRAVGALYVGMQEAPYDKIRFRVNLIFAALLFFGSLTGIALSWYIGSRLARPVKELENMARRVTAGERSVRTSIDTGDEFEELAESLNRMTEALTRREEEVHSLNRNLERKVFERTAELEEKNLLLVKTQEELVRSGKLAELGTLAAGVAHEINNPMAIIRGNAELLQMSIPPEHPDREELDAIFRQVGRVEKIVSSLLTFSRQERRTLGMVDLDRLVEEVLQNVGYQVSLSGIEVVTSLQPEHPVVEADGEQLRQVVTNLILNAVQAMPQGGRLTVATLVPSCGGTVELSVRDTGIGISQHNREKLFTPFFTTKGSGTGMGLAISYGIVKDHGGDIVVESEEGLGACFRVILPQTQTGRTFFSA